MRQSADEGKGDKFESSEVAAFTSASIPSDGALTNAPINTSSANNIAGSGAFGEFNDVGHHHAGIGGGKEKQ